MGLDRRLFISDRWRVEDVQDTLKNLFDIEVTYRPTYAPDYATLIFTLGKEVRQMSVFINYEHGGFRGLLLTLGASGKAEKILKGLAERLGGFYNHQDSDDVWEEFRYVAASNLEWLLKDAVKTGKTDGQNVEKFVKFLKEKVK